MKYVLSVIIASVVAACATPTTDSPDLARVKAACAADALIRPSVDALLSVPGLARPADVVAIKSAQVVIDGICANPTVDQQAALANATGQVIAAYARLKAARSASAPAS